MLADRHADGVFPLRVGLFHLAVGGHQLAVDIETDTLGRDVRAGVIDMTPHGEGADVLEVDVVRRKGRGADEHGAFLGIEPVDAQLRRDLVVRTALTERDAADDIVALAVGQSVQTEALRHVGSRCDICAHLGVVELVDTVLTGYIEGVFHDAQSFVEELPDGCHARRHIEIRCGTMCHDHLAVLLQCQFFFGSPYTMRHHGGCLSKKAISVVGIAIAGALLLQRLHPGNLILVLREVRLNGQLIFSR